MKQTTLPFTSVKRSGSGISASSAKKRKTVVRTSSTPLVSSYVVRREPTTSSSDTEHDSGSDEVKIFEPPPRVDRARKSALPDQKPRKAVSSPTAPPSKSGAPELVVSDRKWAKICKQAMRSVGEEPIHSEHYNRVNHLLRVFDMSYEYGPCIGVTRLDRWERAEAMGLKPPTQIRDILITDQGLNNDLYKQNVLYDFNM
ncbi:hypothetical protein FISHEDRAFT_72364 [Fistulina hepatica ATCC 64428]|uniref:DNA polymerase delta subunit 4 n=1 Tax=Fistulina hepatica ATCC 64428 TaxID=1128425 RepID=A0A0D7AHE6_9AGAR|nr:hypothetical protein FISHEDRAFT_72364 [Fistulina hepatica ATCC 64428]